VSPACSTRPCSARRRAAFAARSRRQRERRHQLAWRGRRSRDPHRLRTGGDGVRQRSVAARDAVHLRLGHEVRVRRRRDGVPQALGPGFGSAADSPLAAARGRAGAAGGDAGAAAGRGGRGRGAASTGSGQAAAERLALPVRPVRPRPGGGGLQVEGLPIVKPPVRRARGHRSRQGRDEVSGTARRHPRQRPDESCASGHDHPKDRTERQRRVDGHQDGRRARRSAGDGAARTAAGRDAARLRQEQRYRGRRGSGCRPRRAARR